MKKEPQSCAFFPEPGGKYAGCALLAGIGKCTPGRAKKCSFSRTALEIRESREKALARLRTLPEFEQQYIAEKYHQGHRPWRDDNAGCEEI